MFGKSLRVPPIIAKLKRTTSLMSEKITPRTDGSFSGGWAAVLTDSFRFSATTLGSSPERIALKELATPRMAAINEDGAEVLVCEMAPGLCEIGEESEASWLERFLIQKTNKIPLITIVTAIRIAQRVGSGFSRIRSSKVFFSARVITVLRFAVFVSFRLIVNSLGCQLMVAVSV